jgi:Ni,Fe-hydrogenase III large subunit
LISFDRPEKSPCLTKLEARSSEYKEALSIIRAGAKALKKTPRSDMPRFVASEGDQQRTERYEEMRRAEIAFRAALKDGRKLYDADIQ